MRIISGKWGGRKLVSVGAGDPKAQLRPTSDRVRESLFNTLVSAYDDPISDAHVLDLFAGTGALGLEALSRGAASATFVESGKKALGLLRANLTTLGAEAAVIPRDATRRPKEGRAFSLVFLDPPYGRGLGEQALNAYAPFIAPGALVVWEESAPPEVPSFLTLLDTRRYGGTVVSFCQKS